MSEALVFIVDDDAAVRDGLSMLCESSGLNAECYDSAESFLDAYRPDQPGCLVLDVRMRAMSGPELHAVLNQIGCPLAIIYLTGHGSIPLTVQSIKAGAVNFLTKPVNGTELLECIRAALLESTQMGLRIQAKTTAANHIASLTEREREVMVLMADGKTNKEIARHLGISHRTVEIHKARIMHKTGVNNLVDLIHLVEIGKQAPD